MTQGQPDHPFIPQTCEISANGFRFRCRTCGPEHGERVLLLHGFPETSWMWTQTMVLLASRGYRCLAPDQRGYSPGARPARVDDYQVDKLASDLLALADALKFLRFHVVGHDWGAVCAWVLAGVAPERLRSLTSLSVPHPYAFLEAKQKDPKQKKKSWYMGFFQLPLLPEWCLAWGDYKMLRTQWEGFSAEEVADCLATFAPFHARKCALNWYRANRRSLSQFPARITTPTLLVWGNQDPYLGRAGILGTEQYMAAPYVLLELDAGHYLVQKNFTQVSAALLQHFAQYGAG